jgi:hypothetical protein
MIGTNVSSIGDYAFHHCWSLPSVTIPSSVTNIGMLAFSSGISMSAIMVDALNPAYCSVDGVLFNKGTNTLIQCPGGKAGSYTLPNTVTTIGNYAFRACDSLTSVTIGTNVTNIGDEAFSSCHSLTNVTIANSVIGDAEFNGCTNLTSITIGNSVANIGSYAFSSCSSLTGVTIPNSVTNIGDSAFIYCTSLKGVYFCGNAPSLGGSVFFGANESVVYYLPGTTDWVEWFGDRPTALWLPEVQVSNVSFGVRTNKFGFNISWASGMAVWVDACTDLANPVWTPLQTNTLASDTLYFSDAQWTNHPARFYRLRWP